MQKIENHWQIKNHWLTQAERCPSTNHNERPLTGDISLLVIHNISLPPGEFGGDYVRQLFCNELDCSLHPYFEQLRQLRVAAHLFIDRAGWVTQFVAFDKRAWHAGKSCHEGRENCNDYSIGIELEGADEHPYSEKQYRQLVLITQRLMEKYTGITTQRIVGHNTIAPQRKTDPGDAFDWDYYHRSLTTT